MTSVVQGGVSFSTEPLIRVRLGEAQPEVRIRGYDLQFQGQKGADRSSEWRAVCSAQGVRLTRKDRVEAIREWKSAVQIRTPGGFLRWGDVQVRDLLTVRPNPKQPRTCDVINELQLERYLIGVVNGEFNSKWATSAIEAQVIAARTYALNEMQRTRQAHFDLESSVKDQVYDGSKKEDHLAARAVQTTRGKVLVAAADSSQPMRTFYHSTCGGLTELPEKVWGRFFPGLKRRVSCPFCKESPKYKWQVELTAEEMQKKLGLPEAHKRIFQLILEPEEGGRVRTVKWVPSQGVPQVFSGVEFRKRLGTKDFPSSRFEVTRLGDRFVFRGGGYGHGVGLCQWGAKVMGEQGYSSEAILRHYFPDARMKVLYQ